MDENFKEIYKDIYNEFKEKYEPAKSNFNMKIVMYIFIAWLVVGTIETIVGRVLSKEHIIYIILKIISIALIFAFIWYVASSMNTNVNYWQKSLGFKNDVGKKFWKKINENITYNPNREEIDKNLVKSSLDNLYNDSKIVDVEDFLSFENINMYTVRFDNSEDKRITGSLVVIENSNKELDDTKEFLNNLNLGISNLILNSTFKNGTLYFLLDAVDVFGFNSLNYFNEEELNDSYTRFKDILKIKESL